MIHVEIDIPDEDRKHRHGYRCVHMQRKIYNYPDEPKPGDEVRFKCVDCHKKGVMKI